MANNNNANDGFRTPSPTRRPMTLKATEIAERLLEIEDLKQTQNENAKFIAFRENSALEQEIKISGIRSELIREEIDRLKEQRNQ
jgi:hypothetical protein